MEPNEEANLPPATNPDVGKPAVAGGQQASRPDAKTRIGGDQLVPNIAERSSRAGVLVQYRYWVGVTPSCPVEHIDLAGINFPKMNEKLVADPMRTQVKRRVPVIGAIVFLTADKIRLMRERLPRTVIRFLDDKGEHQEPGTGQNLGDNHARPRRGQLITIPTSEEIADRRRRGKPTKAYTPRPNDVPAARFMFVQICSDQEHGSRGEYYPETLEQTGLEWPDELDADELLS